MTEIDTRTWRVLARQETDVLDALRAGTTVVIEGVKLATPCVWCAIQPMPVIVELKRSQRPRWTCANCGKMVPLSIDAG
jgi:hypothetical protein